MVYEGAPAEIEIISPVAPPCEIDITQADTVEINDKPQDECGVFAIYAPGRPVGAIAFEAARVQAHRGHSATGMAYEHPYENRVIVKKAAGKPDVALPGMRPHNGMTPAEVVNSRWAMTHNRYSTDENDEANHPYNRSGVVLEYNGHLPRLTELANDYGLSEVDYTSDGDLLTDVLGIAFKQSSDIQRTMANIFGKIRGAYNIIMHYDDQLIAYKDIWDVKPLSLGLYPDGKSGVVASETVVLNSDLVGELASVRDINPGEAIFMGPAGIEAVQLLAPEPAQHCLLESVYTANPNSILFGTNVRQGRVNMGRRLGEANPASSGIVIPMPESGIPAAEGFAEVNNLRLVTAFVKNPNIGRAFMYRADQQVAANRNKLIYLFDKLSAGDDYDPELAQLIENEDVIIVDDSMVRGNSMVRPIDTIKKYNPRSIHLRFASPPIVGPCNLGTDISDKAELVAAGLSNEEIAQKLEVDSVAYNTFEDCEAAINDARLSTTASMLGSFCKGCTELVYPISQPESRPRKDLVVLGQRVLVAAS